jgi:hypothetical protein
MGLSSTLELESLGKVGKFIKSNIAILPSPYKKENFIGIKNYKINLLDKGGNILMQCYIYSFEN